MGSWLERGFWQGVLAGGPNRPQSEKVTSRDPLSTREPLKSGKKKEHKH